MKGQCSKTIQRLWGQHQCPYKGRLRENNKWWCKRHAPSSVKARDEERNTKWNATLNARMDAAAKAKRIHAAEAKVVEAAVKWWDVGDVSMSRMGDAVKELLDARKAAE